MRLDARGAWRGRPRRAASPATRLRLVRERGVADLQPARRADHPRTHFETRYQQYFLYFFDPSAQILVPEPVYVPRGRQSADDAGPAAGARPRPGPARAVRSFIPAGTEVDLSVPVSGDGIADVPLTEQVRELDGEELELVFAQIAWTLRQVSGVERMRITVGGAPLEIPDEGGPPRRVTAWTEFDPSIHWASQGSSGSAAAGCWRCPPTATATSRPSSAPRSTPCATSRSTCPRNRSRGSPRTARPSWWRGRRPTWRRPRRAPWRSTAGPTCSGPPGTSTGRCGSWTVPGQAHHGRRTPGQGRRRVPRPRDRGAGHHVVHALRDGTRFVAVVSAPGGDRVLVSRVLHDQEGQVRRMTRAETLAVGPRGIGGSVTSPGAPGLARPAHRAVPAGQRGGARPRRRLLGAGREQPRRGGLPPARRAPGRLTERRGPRSTSGTRNGRVLARSPPTGSGPDRWCAAGSGARLRRLTHTGTSARGPHGAARVRAGPCGSRTAP